MAAMPDREESATDEEKLGGYLFGAILAGVPFALWAGWLEMTGQADVYRIVVVKGQVMGPNLIGAVIGVAFVFWQPIAALIGGMLAMREVTILGRAGQRSVVTWIAGIGYLLAFLYIAGLVTERVMANGRSESLGIGRQIRNVERRIRADCFGADKSRPDEASCDLEKQQREDLRKKFDPRWWPDLRPEEKRL